MTIESFLSGLSPKRRQHARRIFELVCRDGSLSVAHIGDQLDLDTRTIQNYLKMLQEAGLVHREGGARG